MIKFAMIVMLPAMILAKDDYKQSDYYKNLSDKNKIMYAIDEQDVKNVKKLIKKVSQPILDSLLFYSIPDGILKIVKLLVESGANVNSMDQGGYTPLYQVFDSLVEGMCMCYVDGMPLLPEYFDESIVIAQYLVDAGADLSCRYVVSGYFEDEYGRSLIGLTEPATLLKIVTSINSYLSLQLKNNNFENDREKKFDQIFLKYMSKLEKVLTKSKK